MDKEIIYNDIPEFINYDTDNLLPNEGFPNIIFEETDDYNYATFALDALDEYTLNLSNNKDHAILLKRMIYNKIRTDFNKEKIEFPYLSIDCFNKGFTDTTENRTWEMFKWLYKNMDRYSISSIPHFDKNDSLGRFIIGSNKNTKILNYFDLVEDMVNKLCYKSK